MRAEFEKNFKMLRNLFWNQGKQVTLTKRWKNYGSNTVQTATAMAVYENGFAPVMNGSSRATFSVTLYLSDPFFYGPEETIEIPAATSSTVTVDILGDYETTDITLVANASRNNFRFTNLSEGVYVNVNREITTGSISIDVDAFTAVRSGAGGANVISYVSSFGHPFWFVLRPGEQQIRLTSSSGTGSGIIRYRPRWL
jgi:hypothetical protein